MHIDQMNQSFEKLSSRCNNNEWVELKSLIGSEKKDFLWCAVIHLGVIVIGLWLEVLVWLISTSRRGSPLKKLFIMNKKDYALIDTQIMTPQVEVQLNHFLLWLWLFTSPQHEGPEHSLRVSVHVRMQCEKVRQHSRADGRLWIQAMV